MRINMYIQFCKYLVQSVSKYFSLYKIINIDDLDFDNFFTSNTNVIRNHELKINVNYSRTNLRKHYFTNRVVKYWNALNPITRRATNHNVNMFKSFLDIDNNRIIGCFDYDNQLAQIACSI